MINPLSISPGNYLLDPLTGQWAQIDQVSSNGYVSFDDVDEVSLDQLQPIFLDSAILERCGFEFEDVQEGGTKIMLKCGINLCLTWNSDTNSIWIGEHDTRVNAVHGLQQLVRSLSGKELEISD